MSEWISVEDRLPEQCVECLCFIGKGWGGCAVAFMDSYGDWTPNDVVESSGSEYYATLASDVTHWMPLPPPPK